MIEKLRDNLWKLTFKSFGSNVFLLTLNKKNILIDTGSFLNRKELTSDLEELKLKPDDINIILLTHNHFDHAGNIKIFKKAKIYGSFEDFKNKKINNPFSPSLLKFTSSIKEEDREAKNIIPLEELKIPKIKIIETPGHSKGSVVFYMPKEKILFSGDTIFENGIGRTDLPGSRPEQMKNSLEKVNSLDFDLLCAGHDY